MKIQVNRNNNPTIELPLEKAIYTDALMGEHSLVFTPNYAFMVTL